MNSNDSIAIVGIGCAFPGANDPDAFWRHILNKTDLSQALPASRLFTDLNKLYHPEAPRPDRVYSKKGYVVDHQSLSLDERLRLDPDLMRQLDPMFKLAVYAASQAYFNAKNRGCRPGPGRRHYRQHRIAHRNIDQTRS